LPKDHAVLATVLISLSVDQVYNRLLSNTDELAMIKFYEKKGE